MLFKGEDLILLRVYHHLTVLAVGDLSTTVITVVTELMVVIIADQDANRTV